MGFQTNFGFFGFFGVEPPQAVTPTVSAGYDTVGNVLGFTLGLLLENQRCMDKVGTDLRHWIIVFRI